MPTILPLLDLNSLDLIPLHVNRVSCQGKTYSIETKIKEVGFIWRIQQLTIIIFLSFATVGTAIFVPSIRAMLQLKFKQVLTGKIIFRQLIEQPTALPSLEADEQPKELKRLYEPYIQVYKSTFQGNISDELSLLAWDIEDDANTHSVITPDRSLANLLLQLDKHSKAFFIPDPYFIDLREEKNSNLHTKEGFGYLKEHLTACFANGIDFVVMRLSNSFHSVIGAFRSDGKFKIIDSLSNNTINLNHLTEALNRSHIKNALGNDMVFKGKYINTCLQKGGHECMRMATLYGYQMVKRQGFKGYKEVNGALAQGWLHHFEDIDRIDGAPLLKDASAVLPQNYKSFMHSWAYRSRGIKANSWQELTLADIKPTKNESELRQVFKLRSSHSILSYSSSVDIPINLELDLEENSPPPPSIPLPENWELVSLGSLVPEDSKEVVIIMNLNDPPLIFHIPH